MHIILVLILLIGGLVVYFTFPKKIINISLSIYGGIILFLFGAFRATSVGTDVKVYADTYLFLPNISFEEIFKSQTIVSIDPIYYSFLKVLTYINDSPQFMLIIISAIVAVSVSYFIYKNSLNPLLSFLIFICLRYYAFTLTGLRQAVALAIVLVSYKYLKEKKLMKFLFVICLAAMFHKSALIFIIAYPIANIKSTKKLNIVVLLTLSLNYITDSLIMKLMVKIPVLNHYEVYLFSNDGGNAGTTLLFIYLIILFFAYTVRKSIIQKNKDFYIVYNLTLVGVAITSFSYEFSNIFRVGYYFIFSIILLFPMALKYSLNRELLTLINYIVIILLVGQFILIGPGSGTENYKFFWQ